MTALMEERGRAGPDPGAALTELIGSLKQLADADIGSLPGEDLIALAVAATEAAARLESIETRIAGAIDQSGIWAEEQHRSAAALLTKRCGNRDPETHRRDVTAARRLAHMPLAQKAYADGRITIRHVKKLGECVQSQFDGQFEAFEEELVGYAEELPYPDFVRLVDQWKRWANDALDEETERKDERARELHLARSFKNRGILKGVLTPLARSILSAELQRLERKLFDADWAEATERLGEGNVKASDLKRTSAQRRHDAMVWMAKRSGVADGIELASPTVYVHTTPEDVVEALEADAGIGPEARTRFTDSMRELEDGTPISRRLLLRLLIQAKVRRLVFAPDGEVLDMGRTARWFSKAQREAIAARDRWCTCMCGLSSRFCEIDHVIEYRDGGETDVSNGKPRDRTSHRHKTNQRTRRGRL